jgi:cation transport ATPase
MTDRSTRGVVAFDNSGTLSRVETELLAVRDDDRFAAPVPEVDPRHRVALASLLCEEYTAFDTDAALGTVVDEASVDTRVVLSNTEIREAAADAAIRRERTVPARQVTAAVSKLRDRLTGRTARDPSGSGHETTDTPSPVPVAVQLVVDVDSGTVQRVVAYTTLPRSAAAETVTAVRDLGYEVHLVSGDARTILETVASHTAIPDGHVHANQSASDKADTVATLRRSSGGPVTMVGDYVNDRLAFETADTAVLVSDGADPSPTLAERADTVVSGLGGVRSVLSGEE